MALPIRVAAAQMTSGNDVAANLAACKALAREAKARGATVFGLPECFAFMGASEGEKMRAAEVVDEAKPGVIFTSLREMAATNGMWIIAGGMPEKDEAAPSDSPCWNTCLVVSPAGELVARYRKIHLFDVHIAGKAEHRESASTLAGREVVSVKADGAVMGLSICYDVRFPELYRELTRQGAEILWVPAAFTAHTGAAHWHVLLRARAIENQCFVVAPAQVGKHNEKRLTFGHAMIIDPWGSVLAEVETAAPGLAIADVDLDKLAKVREEMPCFRHRVM